MSDTTEREASFVEEVSCCAGCPFYYSAHASTHLGDYCIHPEVEGGEQPLDVDLDAPEEVPEWCPLRERDTLVQLHKMVLEGDG